MILRLFRRVKRIFQKNDLAEEMELHRAMLEDTQREQGLSDQEARYAARRVMGNVTQAAEEARQVWLAQWVESVWQDLGYAARSLKSQPGFTFMALLALVLGIGLNTSLFTAINSVLFRQWDVPEPDRMVNVLLRNQFSGYGGFSLASVRFLNENSKTVEGVAVARPYRVVLDSPGGEPNANGSFVTGNYFEVIKVAMTLGRGFISSEDDATAPTAVAVLSHNAWTERYAADPAILGRTIQVEEVPFTVIGVLGEAFGGTVENSVDFWAPLASLKLTRPNDTGIAPMLMSPDWCCSGAMARLRSGFSRQQAQAEWNTLFGQYSESIKRKPSEILLTGTAMLDHPQRRRQAAPVIGILMTAIGSILLLACANVSNLLLARASSRQREIAVRIAIGASRMRVVRQLLTESLLLATIASAASLLLAWFLPSLMLRLLNQEPPANLHLTPDLNVLLYSLVITMVAAVGFGLVPALRGVGDTGDASSLKSKHSSQRFRLRGVLLGIQVTVSVTLLIAAGLLARGLSYAHTLDLAFRTEGVSAVNVTLPSNSYDASRQAEFYDTLAARLAAGGDPVGLSTVIPLGNSRSQTNFSVADPNTPENPSMLIQRVSADYFKVLEIPILLGRNFLPEDRVRGSILVNESLARMYWPDRSPVGEIVTIGREKHEIVGVVRNAQIYEIGSVPPTTFAPFVPDGHAFSGPTAVLVPEALASSALATVRQMESRAGASAVAMTAQVDASLGDSAGIAKMAGALGLVALLLATVGVYGVVSYSVEQRRREIGIRMALGAKPGEVAGLVLKRNSWGVTIGLVVGLALSMALSGVLESELHGVSRFDPVAYGSVLTLLLAAAVAASLIPARRAARMDPVRALHHD